MEREDLHTNDYLGNLIRQIPPDELPDNFTDRVMMAIRTTPETVDNKKTIADWLKLWFPYILLTGFLGVIFFTSDIPLINTINGDSFFINYCLACIDQISKAFNTIFQSDYVTWGLLISVAGLFLYLTDRLLGKRFSF